MKKIIYLLSVIFSALVDVYGYVLVFDQITRLSLLMYTLLGLFLLFFGVYGLYAEWLWKKFREKGITQNLCIEASYFVQKKVFFARILLFPFTKIKSNNSLVIAFFGSLAWIIIILVLAQAFQKQM